MNAIALNPDRWLKSPSQFVNESQEKIQKMQRPDLTFGHCLTAYLRIHSVRRMPLFPNWLSDKPTFSNLS